MPELSLTFIAAIAAAVSAAVAALTLRTLHTQTKAAVQNKKRESGQRLVETFISGPEQRAFQSAIRRALTNATLMNQMANALLNDGAYDREGYCLGAEQFATYLRNTFYDVERGLVEPDRVALVIGQAIAEYEAFKNGIVALHGFPVELTSRYFPEVPSELASHLDQEEPLPGQLRAA